MVMRSVKTDYLVVGAGAMGMAFTDALIDHTDVHVTLVDRRHAAGGAGHCPGRRPETSPLVSRFEPVAVEVATVLGVASGFELALGLAAAMP